MRRCHNIARTCKAWVGELRGRLAHNRCPRRDRKAWISANRLTNVVVGGSPDGSPVARAHVPVTESEAECLNSDRLVRTATRRYLLSRPRRASAPTNARSAPRVLTASWRMCAQTAAADLLRGRFDRPRTGKATTSLVRTLRVPGSSTGRLMRQSMQGFRPRSGPYRPTGDKAF